MNYHAEAQAIAQILFGREGSHTELNVLEEALRGAYCAGAAAAIGQTMRLIREPGLTAQDAIRELDL